MKRIVYLLHIVFAAAVLMTALSCEREEPSADLGSMELTFKADGGSESVTYTCNYDWTASSSDQWITVTPSSGAKGSGQLTIQVAANTGSSKRTGQVAFVCEGLTRNVRITQAQPLSQVLSFVTDASSVTVPDLIGNGLTAEVDWGDGTKEDYSTSLSHSYAGSGSHTVTIKLAGGTSLKIGNVAGISKVNLADF
ncbi:MAG: BACON domain-containing protein [Bacteroidales bacterium]|nr:BACON domain-containing protein [Bacteroidales bacterium]